MAKDSGTADRSSGQIQRADTSTPSQIRPAPSARYWHKPTLTPAPPTSKLEPKTTQTPLPSGTSSDINIFQTPIADNAVMSIELLKTEPSEVVELETSDEDEVIEVALPPKPTITIESSDEESTPVVVEPPPSASPQKPTLPPKTPVERNKKQKGKRRAESASPVPSVVSSISDDFIRGDCLAFNISRRQEVEKFDFSLHGSDLIEQHSNTLDQSNTSLSSQKPIKKKNKKKKDKTLSPRLLLEPPSLPSKPSSPSPNFVEHNFSTPKSSKHVHRNYSVNESSIPNADVYESDSNQSAPVGNLTETNIVELPSRADKTFVPIEPPIKSLEGNNTGIETPKPVQAEISKKFDLTVEDAEIIKDPVPVEDNLVMGNVTGMDSVSGISFRRSTKSPSNTSQLPPQMLETVTFRSKKVCRKTMDKYYNESWGGEDFDHHDIQTTMLIDHTLWAVDPRDRVKSSNIKKRCHYCNQIGHHYDRCRWKPRVCHMCGTEGHYEPRCPNKICLRCGAPNAIYSAVCRNCANWNRIVCNICKCFGHPVEACPDQWRRYHNTVENDGILNRQQWRRKPGELFCSGCTRRGHLAHTCRHIPFSNLPLQNPFVFQYSPVFPPALNPDYPTVGPSGRYFTLHEEANALPVREHQGTPIQPDRSPIVQNDQQPITQLRSDQGAHHVREYQAQSHFESDVNKRLLSISETPSPVRSDKRQATASVDQTPIKRRSVPSKETTKEGDSCAVSSTTSEAAIQDSEVSNTSDVVTAAKIYVEKSAIEQLKKPEGSEWLCIASAQNRVDTKLEESPTTFVVVSGLPADQEAFQKSLREFVQRSNPQSQSKDAADNVEDAVEDYSKDIPKNKNDALRMLNAALSSLQADLGDPKTCYKELKWLQNRHMKLLKEKVISPQQLKHSRNKVNGVLKHLNMILLGQAGLAEGSQCIKELGALHEVLTKFRKNSLPQELRNKVGENYHFIFDPVARADYPELLSQYYNEPVSYLGTPSARKALRNKIKNNTFQKKNKMNKKKKRQERQEASSGNMSVEEVQTPNTTANLQSQSKNKSKPGTKEGGNKDKKKTIMNRLKFCQRKLSKMDGHILDGKKQGMKKNLMSRLSKAYVKVENTSKFNDIGKKVYKLIHEIESLCR